MKCPYNNFGCTEIDTSGMSQLTECKMCKHYNNGVRATGAIPGEWIWVRIKKLFGK
jgi:hypothetical protein